MINNMHAVLLYLIICFFKFNASIYVKVHILYIYNMYFYVSYIYLFDKVDKRQNKRQAVMEVQQLRWVN